MSLKRRLVRLEREVEWLWWWGRLAIAEHQLEIIAIQKAMAKAAEERKKVAVKPAPLVVPPRIPAPVPEKPPEKPPPLVVPFIAEPPPSRPFYDPPEHMQIRPVQWRERRSDDYEDDGRGTVLVDYDPLADDG